MNTLGTNAGRHRASVLSALREDVAAHCGCVKRGKEEVGDGKHGVEKGEGGCGKGWDGGDNASDWKLLGVKSVVPPAEASFLLLFTSAFFCTSSTFSSIT